MLRKDFHVPAFDDRDNQRVFALTGLEKTAASLPAGAKDHFSGALRNKIKEVTAHPAYSYMVIIPIGSYEHWGPNTRGDAVLEEHLAPQNWRTCEIFAKRPYGYRTFTNGNFFAHHKNKPQKGDKIYGDVIFSNYNWDMHWVELLVKVFRVPLKEDHPDILGWIDSGTPFDVSMGLYAVADWCPVCGNVRRHLPDPACIHISRQYIGTIEKDGTVACMVNLFPKFHDISGVGEGADSLAHGLMKVASAAKGASVDRGVPASKIPKAAIQRAVNRLSERGYGPKGVVPKARVSDPKDLEKRFLAKKVVEMFGKEASLDPSELLDAGDRHGPALLAALIRNKVLLTPPEFSAAYMGATGNRAKGAILIRRRVTFPFPSDPISPVECGGIVVKDLGADRFVKKSLVPKRSILPKVLRHRLQALMNSLEMLEEAAHVAQTNIADLGIEKNASLEAAYGKYLGMIMTTPDVEVPIRGDSLSMASDREILGIEKVAGLGTLMIAPGITIPLWIMARASAKKNQDASAQQALIAALLGAQKPAKKITIINPPPIPDLRPTAIPYDLLNSLAKEDFGDD